MLDDLSPLHNLHRHLLGQHNLLALDTTHLVVSGFDTEESYSTRISFENRQHLLLNVNNFPYGYLAFAVTRNDLPAFIQHFKPIIDTIEILEMWNLFLDSIRFASSVPFLSLIIESAHLRYIVGVRDHFWRFLYRKVLVSNDVDVDDTQVHPLGNLEILVLVNEESLGGADLGDELVDFCSILRTWGSPLWYIKIYSVGSLEHFGLSAEKLRRLGITVEVEKIGHDKFWQW